MTPFAILIILCTLALGSLMAVSVVNQRQQRNRQIRIKLRKLKARVETMEELVIKLDQLTETRAIPKLINNEVIELTATMMQLDDRASYLQASLANARKREEELNDESSERDICRLLESDAEIARAQHALTEAASILRRQQANGHISVAEMETFISELSWCHLMVESVSLLGQGHKALKRQDILTAHSFYKRAQQALMQSAHSDPRRHRMIKEISEILNNKRKSLSTDLMPENHHNPD